uniref:Fanconi anemia group C protein n=1 Tax=Callorhinchus milii TaxID=7868 RepID=A0A4W3IBP1_CALMI
MAKATSILASSFEFWLNKAIEWGQTTTFESQQDVCLHLSKLQEFLKQIYGTIQHMNTTETIRLFPLIGQLLGRLCWMPFIVAHDECQQNLLQCLWCLYSADPHNAVELKANDLTDVDDDGVRSFIQTLHYPEKEYHSKLLRNIVSSLVKELQHYQSDRNSTYLRTLTCTTVPPRRLRDISTICLPIVTLPDVAPLVDALLTCQEGGLDETLSTDFLDCVSNALQQKKIVLSESAVVNLWLRYLPSLEQTAIHLIESLVSNPYKSLQEIEDIIKDSLLLKASACHPSLYRILDGIFRSILLETDGHPRAIAILQAFTRCFVQTLQQMQIQMPLKVYFPHNHQSLVMALSRHPSDIPSAVWSKHLSNIVQILKRNVQEAEVTRKAENLFQNWFLLAHFGDWVNIAGQELMRREDEITEMLLWLLMFYYKPSNQSQQEDHLLADVKLLYDHLKVLVNATHLNLEDLQTALTARHLSTEQSPLKDMTNHLIMSFLLCSAGGHGIAKESVQLLTLTGDAADGVFELLGSIAHRQNKQRHKDSTDYQSQMTIKLLQEVLSETQPRTVQPTHTPLKGVFHSFQ